MENPAVIAIVLIHPIIPILPIAPILSYCSCKTKKARRERAFLVKVWMSVILGCLGLGVLDHLLVGIDGDLHTAVERTAFGSVV